MISSKYRHYISFMFESRFIIRLANLVLIILLAYFVVNMIMIKFEHSLQTPSTKQVRAVSTYTSQKNRQPLSLFNQILERNLFNSDGSIALFFDEHDERRTGASEVDTSAGASEATTIADIILRGTLYTGDDDGMAIVELKSSKKQNVIQVGEEMGPGIVLVSVHPASVTIKRNGRTERLPLYISKRSETMPLTAGNKKDGIRQSDTNRYEIDQDVLNKNLENVNQIISQIAMRPKLEDGVCVGYEIRRIKEGSIFEDIGLLKADVLQKVNGMDLSNPEDAFRVYKSLIGETSFNIDLIRDGQPTSINYEIR
ncbi:hypothetical protein JXQ70_12780 [bacterium]|nr:hypothetical protein [bacterium]